MTTPTVASGPQRREGARSPRPRVHGPRVAMDALLREGAAKSHSAAKAQISRAWKVLDLLLDAARDDAQLREYLTKRFTPVCARLHADPGAEIQALLDSKAAADCAEDLHLQRVAADPGNPQKRRQLAASLALEQRTGSQLLAALEAR